MSDFRQAFIELALRHQVLRFGQFTLKSGRLSPYFFNAGRFDTGAAIAGLGAAYAQALSESPTSFDMLFGPAYKGIPLVTATAAALAAQHGRDVPFAFNRKEAKDHGEGGTLVGHALAGRVVIVDDVITAGTAIRDSIEIIRRAGATPVGVLLALDRQERASESGTRSAVDEVRLEYGLAVTTILTLDELILRLEQGHMAAGADVLAAMRAYRSRYGAPRGP